MNYIKQLNGVLNQFYKDPRLNPTHISLYLALFFYANLNRFKTFFINREEIMSLAKIGSLNTYHRCMRQLHQWDYIVYAPSHNPYKGSKINLLKFDTTSVQAMDNLYTSSEQALRRKTNNNKYLKTSINTSYKEVFDFFLEEFQGTIPEEKQELEAKKFVNHYQAIGWKVGGKAPMEDWQAAARNWMLKALELERNQLRKSQRNLGQPQTLHTIRNKNYNQPL